MISNNYYVEVKEVRTKRNINNCVVSLGIKRTLLEDVVKKVLKYNLVEKKKGGKKLKRWLVTVRLCHSGEEI